MSHVLRAKTVTTRAPDWSMNSLSGLCLVKMMETFNGSPARPWGGKILTESKITYVNKPKYILNVFQQSMKYPLFPFS